MNEHTSTSSTSEIAAPDDPRPFTDLEKIYQVWQTVCRFPTSSKCRSSPAALGLLLKTPLAPAPAPKTLEEQLLQNSKTSERKSQNISIAELNFLSGRFGTIPASAQLEVLDQKINIWKKLEHIAISELNLMSLNLVHEVRANTGRGFEGVTGIMKQQVALAEKSLQIVEQNLLEAVMNRNLVEITIKMQMI